MNQKKQQLKMVAATTISLVLGALFGSCGSSSSGAANTIPQAEACTQAAQAACAKLFSCTDLVLLVARQTLGDNASVCETMVEQSYCSTFACSATQTYHGDRAKQCKDDFGTLSCKTLADAATAAAASGSFNIAPVLSSVPACQAICTGADAGG